MNCCCNWGIALKDEWPEFECALCPKHGYGALTGSLSYGEPTCSRHTKILNLYAPEDLGGNCATCTNFYDRLYVRSRSYGGTGRYCAHCIDLENTTAGRGGGRHGANTERPRNQPKPHTMHGLGGPCVMCGVRANPRYYFLNQSFSACGWGHAGMFMDAVMDLLVGAEPDPELREGLDYVRKSLGIE